MLSIPCDRGFITPFRSSSIVIKYQFTFDFFVYSYYNTELYLFNYYKGTLYG